MKTEPQSADRWIATSYRVIYADTDAMGIVYYGNYLRFFEMGRNEYLRARGKGYRVIEDRGIYLPVAEVGARYRASARFDDLLSIETRLERVTVARVRFAYRLCRAEDTTLLVDGFTVHGCVSQASGRVTRLPPDLLTDFQQRIEGHGN